jgi:dTDP-4-amino-4,6-dideoxygalactose transaminase
MIKLFNINNYEVDTSKFSNLLHSNIVNEFEAKFAEYVGAKYACSANSASSLLTLSVLKSQPDFVSIPSIIPPVVPNILVNTNTAINFTDDISWVGHSYPFHTNVIDSAQEVTKDQCRNMKNYIVIYSFYPTKPVGSCDGGMVVSDSKETIDWFRSMTMNGRDADGNHIMSGFKFHSNSVQMYLANKNLNKLDEKNEILDYIRETYNKKLGYENTSRHLYRINVRNNKKFVDAMKKHGIICGIHYEACHHMPHFANAAVCGNSDFSNLINSEEESSRTVSIPFHEKLTMEDVRRVIKYVYKLASL